MVFPAQRSSSRPPAVPPWSHDDEGDGPEGGLPSWMAPRSEEDEEEDPPPPPAAEPGAIDDREAAAEEAALYDQATTRLSLPPMTPPPAAPEPERAARLEVELETARSQLAAALEEAHHYRRRVLEASETQLVDLALAVAERVVGRELATDRDLVAAWAREGLETLADRGPVSVRVSPDVEAALRRDGTVPAMTVEVDASLPPASCRLQGAEASLDAGFDGRLAAVVDAVGARGSGGGMP
ncbi:MAG: FliH/SctL family protein [Myxococcota bacterium]